MYNLNQQIPNFINEEKINKAIEMYSNSEKNIETIQNEITELVNKMIEEYKEKRNKPQEKHYELNDFFNYICALIVSLLNFYSIVFLVIRIKEFKKILPYSVIYIVILAIINNKIPAGVEQLLVPCLNCCLLYFIANKNKRYILYGVLSMVINIVVQYLCYYLFKVKYLNAISIKGLNYLLSSIDYFIVMFFIILVKEVYLKYKKEA